MANFKQICKIKTHFRTKEPELTLRENNYGKFLNGKIQWLDGKDKEGKQLYTWLHFSTFKQEIIDLLTNNPNELLEVEGFLKNNTWQDKEGNWKSKVEVLMVSASLKQSIQKHPAEVDDSKEIEDSDDIPF